MARQQLSPARHQQLDGLLNKCVHCGFCNATCPSYKVLGNELDGPRGRIYLIARLAAGESNDPIIRDHLDLCLTCRNCETTCPSQVEYGKILDIGRQLSLQTFGRPLGQKIKRALLVALLSRARLVQAGATAAALLRPVLPGSLRRVVPRRSRLPLHVGACTKRVALIAGCVQPGLSPNTDRALHNLLSRQGIALVPISATCCGALAEHNDAVHIARDQAKQIIDAFDASNCSAVLMSASACFLQLKHYPWLLRDDVEYAARAREFAARLVEPAELLDLHRLREQSTSTSASLAFHPPCTLQHGLGEASVKKITDVLEALGFRLVPVAERNLCCGSAGTYALHHPQVAQQLRTSKLGNLQAASPDYLATANIGCQTHLQQGTRQRVWHWLELVEKLAGQDCQTDRKS